MTGQRFVSVSGLPPETPRAFARNAAQSHNRIRPFEQAVGDAQPNTEGIGDALSPGVTGENSPLYTNQSAKMKTDRVLVKYFFAGTTWLRHTNASSPSSLGLPARHNSENWRRQKS
jgi:hypothetical protein